MYHDVVYHVCTRSVYNSVKRRGTTEKGEGGIFLINMGQKGEGGVRSPAPVHTPQVCTGQQYIFLTKIYSFFIFKAIKHIVFMVKMAIHVCFFLNRIKVQVNYIGNFHYSIRLIMSNEVDRHHLYACVTEMITYYWEGCFLSSASVLK